MKTIQNSELTPKKYMNLLTLIFMALLLGQLLFVVLVIFTIENFSFNILDFSNPLFFIIPILAIGSFYGSQLIFNQNLISINKNNNSLKEKLMAYQHALIIKLAFIEGPSLFGIVAFLISGNLYFLLISVLLVFYFYTQKPTKEKMISQLNLNFEQRIDFNKSDEVLK
jgi:hypothetical protein